MTLQFENVTVEFGSMHDERVVLENVPSRVTREVVTVNAPTRAVTTQVQSVFPLNDSKSSFLNLVNIRRKSVTSPTANQALRTHTAGNQLGNRSNGRMKTGRIKPR